MRAHSSLPLLALSLLMTGCFVIDKIRGNDEDDAEGEEAEAGEAEAEAEAKTDEPVAEAKPKRELPTGVDRFKHWAPRHAFIGSPTVVAQVLDDQELIVATADSHVGISTDGGGTWTWTKSQDYVRDVSGYPGGPYATLHEGAISLSDDGLLWRRLPRFSSDSLIDLVAADIGFVAIGKSGDFIHVGKDGSGGHGGTLPDKFKAKALTELNGAVLAWSGKTGYGTTDGTNWTELEQLPPMPDGKTFLTSAGSCSIAKVGKRKGVKCTVSGTAHGIGDEFIVENKGVAALTRDGGETWVTAALPFKGANAIFGAAGGPYYAVGNGGGVAISKDGTSWVDQKWDETANLLHGVVSGSTVIIVGAKGTIIFSKDGGSNWDYATPPVSKTFSWVGKPDGAFVVSDGRVFLSSSDGSEWVETEETYELPGKPGTCDEAPEDGESCKYGAEVTTPEDMPDVRGLTFTGDVGVALGDDALIAVTTDGGGNWSASHGYDLGRYGLTNFAVAKDQILVTDGERLLASSDAGATWVEGETIGKYKINDVHVVAEGNKAGLWLAAVKNDVLAAKLSPETWLPAGNEDLKGDWRVIFEVGGVIFVSGSKGELLRSEDGDTWTEVITGIPSPIIDMAGDGQNVWATTAPSRRANNILLRSEDGGAHFIVVQEMPGATDQPDLRVEGSAVMWADVVSHDLGESWKRETERYFPGLVDVADGSGMEITNLVYRYSGDRLYVITGAGEHDWLRIDSAYNEGGVIDCSPTSGCWMLAGGKLYRPLGR